MAKRKGITRSADSQQIAGVGRAGSATEVISTDGPKEYVVPHDANQDRGPKWREQYSIIPVAIALAVSLNSLANGFAADDLQQILNNPFIKDLANIPSAFTNTVWTFSSDNIIFTTDQYYRPIFNILLSVNYAIFGTSAWGWHLVNILIDACVAYLVFLVIRQTIRSNWMALTGAVLFAAHPIHAESVAWVSGMTDPLMALFVLPSFLFYLRYRDSEGKLDLAAWLLLLFLGLLCKETALALPVLIVYCELWHFDGQGPFKARARKAAIAAGFMAIPILVYVAMRSYVLGGVVSGGEPRLGFRVLLLTLPKVVVEYVRLMFVPTGYSYMHFVMPVTSVFKAAAWGWAAVVFGIVVAIVLSRSKAVWFAAVFFIAWLAPALAATRGFEPEFMVQERYLYLSSVGGCMVIALALGWLWNRRSLGVWRHSLAAATMLVITTVFLVAHVRQNSVWSDNISLYQNCVVQDPSLTSARAALGFVYFQAGKVKQAEAEERQAIDLDPGAPDPYISLSSFANSQGKIDQAIGYLQDGVRSVPRDPGTTNKLATAYLNLGMLYERQKNFDSAESAMEQSVDLWRRPAGLYYLGQLYVDEARYQQALGAYQEALGELPHRFAPIHLKLAHVYEELGDKAHARAEYQQFIDIAPDADARRDAARRLAAL